ncbi:MAG: hypothetical protein ACE5OS_15585 [Anaerolineae bacterium]
MIEGILGVMGSTVGVRDGSSMVGMEEGDGIVGIESAVAGTGESTASTLVGAGAVGSAAMRLKIVMKAR